MTTPVEKWGWDSVTTYRLTQEALEDYLTKKYGFYKFNITPSNGNYKFWIPGKLSDADKKDLRAWRYAIRDSDED